MWFSYYFLFDLNRLSICEKCHKMNFRISQIRWLAWVCCCEWYQIRWVVWVCCCDWYQIRWVAWVCCCVVFKWWRGSRLCRCAGVKCSFYSYFSPFLSTMLCDTIMTISEDNTFNSDIFTLQDTTRRHT